MSRSITTTVEVDLDDFDTAELIAELRSRWRDLDWREKDALLALAREIGDEPDADISHATHELILGRRKEALVWLERALPREWRGKLA